MKFKVALLQTSAFGDDQEKNLAKDVQACLKAKARGGSGRVSGALEYWLYSSPLSSA
jgi:hypothetical protein